MLFCQVTLLTCHIWHCCLIRVKAPHFHGGGILISLGKWGAGDRKVWKVDKAAVAESTVAMLGKCGCPQSLSDISPLPAVTYLQLWAMSHTYNFMFPKHKFHNFQMNIFARCLLLSQKGESDLFLCSPLTLRVAICFAFVLTWIGHSVKKRRLMAFPVLQCPQSTVSRANLTKPDSTASLLPVSIGLIWE